MSDRSLSALEGELEAARRDLEDQRKSFFSLSAQHEDHKRRQANVLTTARKEAERAKAEASELRARSVVLAETVETLSSGSMGEIDQRLIHLTHQLASAGTNQVRSEGPGCSNTKFDPSPRMAPRRFSRRGRTSCCVRLRPGGREP